MQGVFEGGWLQSDGEPWRLKMLRSRIYIAFNEETHWTRCEQVGGRYPELFRLDDPIGGEHMNIFKAGLITAHRIVAVSHGCARPAHKQAVNLL